MQKPIINIDEVEYKPFPMPLPERVKAKYEGALMGRASETVGAQKLGYSVMKVPAGKRAFPFHNHRVNEEAFFVLEGEGEVRIGSETFPIKKGDFIAHPPGGQETAHQIINTSKSELKYIGISTKESPEIAEYPETKKFGIMAFFGGQMFRFLAKEEQPQPGYWDGE